MAMSRSCKIHVGSVTATCAFVLLVWRADAFAAQGVSLPGTESEFRVRESDCGIVALAVCLAAVDRQVSIAQLIAKLRADGVRDRPLSMLELKSAASAAHANVASFEWPDGIPAEVPGVAIVAIRGTASDNHFVALGGFGSDGATKVDFPLPSRRVTWRQLRESAWNGIALHILANDRELAQLTRVRAISRFGTPVAACLTGALFYGAAQCVAHARRRPSRQKAVRRSCTASGARAENASGRIGVSGIEVLVVLALIALLLSLLVPALAAARESARRAQCQNNLRQLVQACASHHAALGKFPASPVRSFDYAHRTHAYRDASMFVPLLPYLDLNAIYSRFNFEEDGAGAAADPATSRLNAELMRSAIRVFRCPSDDAPPHAANYRGCVGTGPDLYSTVPLGPNAARRGVFSFVAIRDSQIRDGLSQTIFFSERVVGDQNRSRYTPFRDVHIKGLNVLYPDDVARECRFSDGALPAHLSFTGSTWMLSGLNNTWYNHALGPNSATTDCGGIGTFTGLGAVSARSWHPGGGFRGVWRRCREIYL